MFKRFNKETNQNIYEKKGMRIKQVNEDQKKKKRAKLRCMKINRTVTRISHLTFQ